MKHLVMLGAGHAHVHLLSTLAKEPLAGVQITLIAPYPHPLYSGMVAGFVAGHYALEDCMIALTALLENTGITWQQHPVTALDVQQKTVTLDDGSTLAFDMLSINTGTVQNRQHLEQLMPGAREHALFIRPLESFAALWPKVVELEQQKPLRFAVMGAGAAAFELACAVAHRFPSAAVTLLRGDAAIGANYPKKIQSMMTQTLRNKAITVLQERAVGMSSGEVLLSGGARLACDVPLVVIGAQAPAWLQDSGLALDAQGFVAVDAYHRSTSHPHVFAAEDIATRVDLNLPRSGSYAMRAASHLAKNLRVVLAGLDPSPYTHPSTTMHLFSCGHRYAIASWGDWSAQGRWVWWLKNWLDRRFLKKYNPR